MKKHIASAIAAVLATIAISPCVSAAELSAEQQRHYELVQPALEQYDKFGFDSADDMFRALLNRSCDYDPDHIYDLTGDDALTMGDAMFILSFLGGNAAYNYNYSEMDGNADNVIDRQDAFAYLQYWDDIMLYYITDNCITTHTAGTYTPQTREYRRYSASTGAFLGRYTLVPLTPSVNTLSSVPDNAAGSFNEENLLETVPDSTTYHSGVVRIDTSIGHYSGFAVEDHVIATSAQAFVSVSNEYEAKASTQINRASVSKVAFYTSASAQNTTYTGVPVEYHIPERYFHGTGYGHADIFDYALITMDTSFSTISNLNYFDFGIALNTFTYPGSTLYATGAFKSGSSAWQETYSGSVYNHPMPTDRLFYYMDLDDECIGAPIYTSFSFANNNYCSALAIHAYNYPDLANPVCSGVRITSDIIHFYLNNASNIHY